MEKVTILGKHSGVIIDYANVFASLEKALVYRGSDQGKLFGKNSSPEGRLKKGP